MSKPKRREASYTMDEITEAWCKILTSKTQGSVLAKMFKTELRRIRRARDKKRKK